jgi:hypothetical protein
MIFQTSETPDIDIAKLYLYVLKKLSAQFNYKSNH